ncbi:hypothetical protein V502_08365 [Pseudogymnoascus sp. VKM F-4520 (FW-2644)]|nr:hypothetical protein V502_08365 [Pseudogymnoascus sp. VKM F-4520 (FW-2644)]
MSAIIAVVKSPEKMSDALHTPSALLSPGHVSWYRYVGLSTGNTILSCADSALKVGTHDTYRTPWIITSPNRVYAVAMWNVSVVDTDSEKKDASALCQRDSSERAIPLVDATLTAPSNEVVTQSPPPQADERAIQHHDPDSHQQPANSDPGVPNGDVEAGLYGEKPLAAGSSVAMVVGAEGEGDREGEGGDERGSEGVQACPRRDAGHRTLGATARRAKPLFATGEEGLGIGGMADICRFCRSGSFSPRAVLASRKRLFPAAADVPRYRNLGSLGRARSGRVDGVPGDRQPF